jgi:hypothetical protein
VKVGGGYLALQHVPAVIVPGVLRMSEALYWPAPGIAATGEWVELYNATNASFDLAGFQLDFGGGLVHTLDPANGNTVVPPQGFLVLGQSSVPAENDGVPVEYVYGPTYAMDDATGTLTLLLQGGAVAGISWSAGLGGEGIAVQSDVSAALYVSGAGSSSCSATSPFGTQSPQQLGTPGSAGGCFAYALSSIPVDHIDLSTVGTTLLSSDSAYSGFGNFTLPAPFPYFGTVYNAIGVSMVGFTTLGSPLTAAYDVTNDTFPSTSQPNGVVAAFWDRIVRNTGGRIAMHRMVDHTIIGWHDFRTYAQSSTSLYFQQKLFDNGVIEFHYGVMDPGTYAPDMTTGGSATVWIERPDGTAALPFSINTVGAIQPHSAIRFTPLQPQLP